MNKEIFKGNGPDSPCWGAFLNIWKRDTYKFVSDSLGIIDRTDIKAVVAVVFNIDIGSLSEDRRYKEIIEARFAAFMLYHKHRNYSYSRIGKIFNRDHTTVIHGIKRGNDLLANDKFFRKSHRACIGIISGGHMPTVSRPNKKPKTRRRTCLYTGCEKRFFSDINRLCRRHRLHANNNAEFEGV